MYESANGQMAVTSQQSALPFFQGTRESPSERFPSERDKPVGSFLIIIIIFFFFNIIIIIIIIIKFTC